MTEQLIRGKVNATKGITSTKSIHSNKTVRAELLQILKQSSYFDIIWYSSFLIVGAVCIVLFHKEWMIYLTVAELYSGLLAANLIARGKIIGIWINIFDCVLYGVIAYLSHAYGEIVKVLIISNIFNIYGLLNWTNASKKQTKSNEFNVRLLGKKRSAIIYPLYIAATVGVYFILNAFGTNKAYLGCITFTGNITIKYLQMSRYKEAWYFAIFGDFVSVLMWTMILIDNIAANGDWSVLPTVAGSLGFFINAINGMLVWNKLYRRSVMSGSVYLAMRPVKITKLVTLRRNYAHLKWSQETDHMPTKEEIEIARKMRVSFRRGMFSGS